MPHKVIISGGGTGGHIFPAVAIAKELQSRYPDCKFLFIGANGRMEMEKIPQEGFDILGLDVAGLKRSLSLTNFQVIYKFIKSYFKAKNIVRQFQPDVVIGTGGYASLAVLYAAERMQYPTLIWEGNGYAGLTNKILAKKASIICTGLPEMEKFFPATKTVFTGNPVRKEILSPATRSQALQFFGLDPEKPVVFITGGSLGARTINQAIQKSLPFFAENHIQLIWQTGKIFKAENNYPTVKVYPFLNEINLAYAAADIVVSRAGALSIAEIAASGKPAILVPSPNVTEDHQTQNALKLTNHGAAQLLKDTDAAGQLHQQIRDLIQNESLRKQMQNKLANFAKPDATSDIANQIESIWKK